MGRATCYRCHKPQVTCICGTLKEVVNRTPVWVIQHPRERHHPLGTARIARLGLQRVEVVVTAGDGEAPDLPPRAALLYPGGAELTSDVDLDALVVIDGTWPQAKSLYRRCGWLQSLPHYRLTPRQQSRYRVRREPAPHCVSTVEAIVEALRRTEPETSGLDGLLDAFDAMIDRQIALSQTWEPRVARHWGHRLMHQSERIVAVELDLGPRTDGPPLMLHAVAWRLATGETFESFVSPGQGRRPHPCHLAHLQLDQQCIETGHSEDEQQAAWRRFVSPSDLVVAWSAKTLRALDEANLWGGPTITLKSTFRQAHPAVRGPLDEVLAHLGLDPLDLHLSGRAGRQLGAVASLLQERPTVTPSSGGIAYGDRNLVDPHR